MSWLNTYVPVVYHGITATQMQQFVDNFSFLYARPRLLLFRAYGSTDNVIVAASIGGDVRLPISGTITDCGCFHDTAGTTGTEVVDIHLDGTTIMASTKISVATGQKSSEDGGATQPVLTTTAYTANGIFTFHVDTAHTTPALGMTCWVAIRET